MRNPGDQNGCQAILARIRRLTRAKVSSWPAGSFHQVCGGGNKDGAQGIHSPQADTRAGLLIQLPYFTGLQGIIPAGDAQLHGVAAYLTIFDISLVRNGGIQEDGDGLPAIRALNEMLVHVA